MRLFSQVRWIPTLLLLLGTFLASFSNAATRLSVLRTTLAASGWALQPSPDENAWAPAARDAYSYCEFHGFAAGLLDGNVWNDQFGVLCFAPNEIEYFVPTNEELTTAGFGLQHEDINEENWAVARRAAQRYCETQGDVMGFANGHQANGHYGIVCLKNPALVHRFAIQVGVLDNTGWSLQSPIANTNWAVASRAAQRVCEQLGYLAGWLDGHENSDRLGLLCSQ